MPDELLFWKKDEQIVFIKLSGIENKQEKIRQLSDELFNLFSSINVDTDIQVVVIAFTGEIRLDDVISHGEFTPNPFSLSKLISEFHRPVIAAIQGDIIGIMLELALACDMRIASESSHFGLPHIRTGAIPSDGGTQRLARIVGRSKAMEMILTGESIDARDAFKWGLVNQLSKPENLMSVATKIASGIASKAPVAVRYAKEAIVKGMDLKLEQGLRLEADLYFLLHTTSDRIEGIKAFQEKRKPRFHGR